jgi:hypothetical protein
MSRSKTSRLDDVVDVWLRGKGLVQNNTQVPILDCTRNDKVWKAQWLIDIAIIWDIDDRISKRYIFCLGRRVDNFPPGRIICHAIKRSL